MAKLSGNTVIVEQGDTLSAIAKKYTKMTYKQLASINNIPNPDLIYVGQVIKLTGTASSSSASNSNRPTITHFGLQSNDGKTLFATWSWPKKQTASYKTEWVYKTEDVNDVWFDGSSGSNTVDSHNPEMAKISTFTIPDGAKYVKFRVKPISETHTVNEKETSYWTANWSNSKTYNVSNLPPSKPNKPSVKIDKYKITVTVDGAGALNATGIQFAVYKNHYLPVKTAKVNLTTTGYVSYTCTVDAGANYQVQCRAFRGKTYSDWSDFSDDVESPPAAPSEITTLKASSKTSIYIEWAAAGNAAKYEIQYTTEKIRFDSSSQKPEGNVTIENGVTHCTIELGETTDDIGKEYFFRIRAGRKEANGDETYSGWTAVKSIVMGEKPSAPTTWSSTTTAIVGEPLLLYWIHNSRDGSDQTLAKIQLYVDGVAQVPHVEEIDPDDAEENKTCSYEIDTTDYPEGTKLQWKICTAGITGEYSDWSAQRTVDIYAPPSLELKVTDKDNNLLDTVQSFPFYIHGLASPNTQAPIGYHVSILSNEIYETVDTIGNVRTVNKDEEVYKKYFDTTSELLVEMSAYNVDLENDVSYTVRVTVAMNSGLTAEATAEFDVSWTDLQYEPNAEIYVDKETLVANIKPYCEESHIVFRKVTYSAGSYILTDEIIEVSEGYPLQNGENFVYTTTGEQVFSPSITIDSSSVYYSTIEEKTIVEDVLLSVYRREYDGSFTEIATGIENNKSTFVTDPHPALDYARYRIVAITTSTGAVSYYDLPGYSVGEKAVIIQWDEQWSSFDTWSEDAFVQPPWAGSLLRLPYNIDISDNSDPDVSLIKYAGREHPVTYYGTQLGETATWNVDIEKNDKETLYGLRRLRRWMGDVYVREPSGSGYWANIKVSFSQKHCEVAVPITFNITRVEGGV